MPSVPPTGNNPPPVNPDNVNPSNTPAPPATTPGGGGSGGMTAFMATFTPEQRKKFMNILVQNLTNEIQKASKKYVEELQKERQKIQEQQ